MVAGLLAVCPAPAQACSVEFDGEQKVESIRYVLAFRTQPARLAVGSHFSVEFAVCPKAGQPAPESVRVDGYMPDHRHGMNYRPSVKPATDGRQIAEGLMFHMPGRWDFIFEVRGGGQTDRLTRGLVLE
jgi:hypothetical protein